MRSLAAIAASILMATNTVAVAVEPIVGAGAMSCGKLIAVDERDRGYFFTWAQGYLTGLNVKYLFNDPSGFGSTDLQDRDGQKLWLENYCRENALDTYWSAVNQLWAALRERQGLERDSRFKPKE